MENAETPFLANADELLEHNSTFVQVFADHGLNVKPKRRLAIVACMDSRMDIFQMLGLDHGDAHIIRNAGGVVTDDGLENLNESDFYDELVSESGIKPGWSLEAFKDPHEDVRQSMSRLKHSPFILHKDHIRGFVYEVENGKLVEVV